MKPSLAHKVEFWYLALTRSGSACLHSQHLVPYPVPAKV